MQFFRVASALLVLISLAHLCGHLFFIPELQLTTNFSGQLPANDTERNLLRLMSDYKRTVGGSQRSIMDLQTGLGLAYALFFLWCGILNLMLAKGLVRNKRLLVQISMFNAVMLFGGAWISWLYFFWLPLASFLTCGILFVAGSLKMRKEF